MFPIMFDIFQIHEYSLKTEWDTHSLAKSLVHSMECIPTSPLKVYRIDIGILEPIRLNTFASSFPPSPSFFGLMFDLIENLQIF
jgi:hypothetical protein